MMTAEERSRKTICFDLDGTICTNTFGEYERATPLPWAVERVRALHRLGHSIVIMTARGSATGIDWDATTRAQLGEWGVPFDELRFGKPSADVYVDDRAVHTTAWQVGDVSGVPGFSSLDGDELPTMPLPHFSAIVETGRTYGNVALDLDDHVRRLTETARAAGIPLDLHERELVERVQHALSEASLAEELVYTLALAGAPQAGFLDAWPAVPSGELAISRRPLRHVLAGLRRFLVPGGIVALAAEAWPLVRRADGEVTDAAGGDVALVSDGTLVLHTPPRGVAGLRLLELARRDGIQVDERAPREEEVERADEVLVAALPFCLLPLGTSGPVAKRLLAAWSDWAGVDLERQTADLVGEGSGG